MSKPKRKAQQQNFLQYIWNDLFRVEHEFSLETELSIDDCVKLIRGMSEEEQGCFETISFTGDAYLIEDTGVFEFTAVAKNTFGSNALAVGTIQKTDSVFTQLNGASKVTNWTSAVASLVIGILSAMGIISANYNNVICQIIMLPVPLFLLFFYLWFGMYDDRNKLIRILENRLQLEKSHG